MKKPWRPSGSRGDGRDHLLGRACTGTMVDDHPVFVFRQNQRSTDAPTGSSDHRDSRHQVTSTYG
jgi:hypothetical protein